MWLTHFWHSWSQFFIFAWDVTAGGILRTGVLICLVVIDDGCFHCTPYSNVIMDVMASQITSLTIVYSTMHSEADQRKYESSTSLAYLWGIHWWPVQCCHNIHRFRFVHNGNNTFLCLVSDGCCARPDLYHSRISCCFGQWWDNLVASRLLIQQVFAYAMVIDKTMFLKWHPLSQGQMRWVIMASVLLS